MKTKLLIIVTCLVASLLLLDFLGVPLPGRDSAAERLVKRNIAARGGSQAWDAVSTLRFKGSMDLGQGLRVPYVLEQKRPDKVRLEFVFNGATAVQTVNGSVGWKFAQFRGQSEPAPMTEFELRETAAGGAPSILLDFATRGGDVEIVGEEVVDGREAIKLKVTLAGGAERWLYLDAQTYLDLKMETIRNIAGREEKVETVYSGWQNFDGVLLPNLQQSRVAGAQDWNSITIDSVEVNVALDDARFAKPVVAVQSGV